MCTHRVYVFNECGHSLFVPDTPVKCHYGPSLSLALYQNQSLTSRKPLHATPKYSESVSLPGPDAVPEVWSRHAYRTLVLERLCRDCLTNENRRDAERDARLNAVFSRRRFSGKSLQELRCGGVRAGSIVQLESNGPLAKRSSEFQNHLPRNIPSFDVERRPSKVEDATTDNAPFAAASSPIIDHDHIEKWRQRVRLGSEANSHAEETKLPEALNKSKRHMQRDSGYGGESTADPRAFADGSSYRSPSIASTEEGERNISARRAGTKFGSPSEKHENVTFELPNLVKLRDGEKQLEKAREQILRQRPASISRPLPTAFKPDESKDEAVKKEDHVTEGQQEEQNMEAQPKASPADANNEALSATPISAAKSASTPHLESSSIIPSVTTPLKTPTVTPAPISSKVPMRKPLPSLELPASHSTAKPVIAHSKVEAACSHLETSRPKVIRKPVLPARLPKESTSGTELHQPAEKPTPATVGKTYEQPRSRKPSLMADTHMDEDDRKRAAARDRILRMHREQQAIWEKERRC